MIVFSISTHTRSFPSICLLLFPFEVLRHRVVANLTKKLQVGYSVEASLAHLVAVKLSDYLIQVIDANLAIIDPRHYLHRFE